MMNIVYIETKKLRPAEFNPPQRTAEGATGGLLARIKEHGVLVPLAVTEKLIVIDGHRRLSCAKQLGHGKVPAIVYKAETPEEMRELWWELNREHRRLSPAEVLWFYTQGGQPEGHIGNTIALLEQTIGPDGLRTLAEMQTVSPEIIDEARKVSRYCGLRNNKEFTTQVLWWLLKHKQRYAVRHVIDLYADHNIIKLAVEEDRPLKIVVA